MKASCSRHPPTSAADSLCRRRRLTSPAAKRLQRPARCWPSCCSSRRCCPASCILLPAAWLQTRAPALPQSCWPGCWAEERLRRNPQPRQRCRRRRQQAATPRLGRMLLARRRPQHCTRWPCAACADRIWQSVCRDARQCARKKLSEQMRRLPRSAASLYAWATKLLDFSPALWSARLQICPAQSC